MAWRLMSPRRPTTPETGCRSRWARYTGSSQRAMPPSGFPRSFRDASRLASLCQAWKGQVQTIRGRFFKPRLRFASLEELNGWLEAECLRWAATHPDPDHKEMTVAQVLELERPALQPMWDLPPALARLRRKLGNSDDADRRFVRVLAAVLSDGLDAVEGAVREALDAGAVSDEVVLNILSRRREPPGAASIVTPGDLALMHPPIANCARYDSLRGLHAAA